MAEGHLGSAVLDCTSLSHVSGLKVSQELFLLVESWTPTTEALLKDSDTSRWSESNWCSLE